MTKVPSLGHERIRKALQRDGWVGVRRKGSHIRLQKHLHDEVLIYNWGMNILAGLALFCFPLFFLFSKKRRANLLKRAGFSMKWKRKKAGEKRIWIHALSFGEVRSALPLVKAVKRQYGDFNIIFTASTKTGFDLANQLFYGEDNKIVDQLGYFPFDLRFIVKKTISQLSPDAVIIVETDIWPNFLYELEKQNIPVILVNARLSARSLKGYLLFRTFFSNVFSRFSAILVQSPVDANRFRQLSIPNEKIKVAGNIKFDQPIEDMSSSFISEMKTMLGITRKNPVFLAGSTHEGEEAILCQVFQRLLTRHPGLIMILAPRTPERCKEISSLFLSEGFQCVLFSDIQSAKHLDCKQVHSDSGNFKTASRAPVVLLNIMGILSRLYAICNVAYIGGSMVKEGGHNPLEAAAFAKPLLFGPDMSDFLWISEQLIQNGGALQVDSEQALGKELENLFKNPELQQEMGKKNRKVFFANTGAVQNILKQIQELSI